MRQIVINNLTLRADAIGELEPDQEARQLIEAVNEALEAAGINGEPQVYDNIAEEDCVTIEDDEDDDED